MNIAKIDQTGTVGKPVTSESFALTQRFVKARIKGKTYQAIADSLSDGLSLQAVRSRIVRFEFDYPTEYKTLVKAQKEADKAKAQAKRAPKVVTTAPVETTELAVAA